jgi:hypothetical protein
MYRLRSRGRKARCVSRAREQDAATSNSKLYCEGEADRLHGRARVLCSGPEGEAGLRSLSAQRRYRVREAYIVAENPCVTGIIYEFTKGFSSRARLWFKIRFAVATAIPVSS